MAITMNAPFDFTNGQMYVMTPASTVAGAMVDKGPIARVSHQFPLASMVIPMRSDVTPAITRPTVEAALAIATR